MEIKSQSHLRKNFKAVKIPVGYYGGICLVFLSYININFNSVHLVQTQV